MSRDEAGLFGSVFPFPRLTSLLSDRLSFFLLLWFANARSCLGIGIGSSAMPAWIDERKGSVGRE